MPHNHTLTLWQHKTNGKWYAVAYVPDQKLTIRRSLRTTDKAEAEAALPIWETRTLPGILAARNGGGGKPETAPRLTAVAAWYYESHLPATGASDKTILNCSKHIGGFVTFLAARRVGRLDQLSSRLVQEWQVSDGNRRDALLVVRRWLSEYRRMHPKAPALDIEWNIPARKQSRRFQAIPSEDLAKFLQRLADTHHPIYPIVSWVACTGWRISDTLDLKWAEVKRDHIDRRQLKTGNGLAYPITPRMRAVLDSVPRDDERVFPVIYKTFLNRLHAFEAKEGFPRYTMRDLRVTFATTLADDGCPMHVLAALLGHKDPMMAAKYYVRMNAESMRAWAEKY